MKPIKILTIIFVLSFAVSFLYSQETAGDSGSSVVNEDQSKAGNGEPAGTPGKEVKETGASTDSTDSGTKRISEDSTKSESPAKTVKKRTGTSTTPEEKVAANVDNSNSGDDYLLSINEGNFKYKRIPDIKLADKSPSMAEQSAQDMNNASSDDGSDNSAGTGFFGLSKNTADIVAKGGILLLVLGIFILYKFRSRKPGRRSSGSSVMNSYRK